jgi:tetratricopeptide (TPR) repeat protein
MSPAGPEEPRPLKQARRPAGSGRCEEAEKRLEGPAGRKMQEQEPESPLFLAALLAESGKTLEAMALLRRLLAADSQDLAALDMMGHLYRQAGRLKDALRVFTQASKTAPGRLDFHFHKGNLLRKLGNHKAACLSYTDILKLDRNHIPSYNNLGVTYADAGEQTKALLVFQQGLTLDQDNPALLFNYGALLERWERFKDAAFMYQKALEHKPGWDAPRRNLGALLFQQGKTRAALALFMDTLFTDPAHPGALNNMGAALLAQGRHRAAAAYFKQALRTDPNCRKAADNLRLAEAGTPCLLTREAAGAAFDRAGMIIIEDADAGPCEYKAPAAPGPVKRRVINEQDLAPNAGSGGLDRNAGAPPLKRRIVSEQDLAPYAGSGRPDRNAGAPPIKRRIVSEQDLAPYAGGGGLDRNAGAPQKAAPLSRAPDRYFKDVDNTAVRELLAYLLELTAYLSAEDVRRFKQSPEYQSLFALIAAL